jgi:hypothetical protein
MCLMMILNSLDVFDDNIKMSSGFVLSKFVDMKVTIPNTVIRRFTFHVCGKYLEYLALDCIVKKLNNPTLHVCSINI